MTPPELSVPDTATFPLSQKTISSSWKRWASDEQFIDPPAPARVPILPRGVRPRCDERRTIRPEARVLLSRHLLRSRDRALRPRVREGRPGGRRDGRMKRPIKGSVLGRTRPEVGLPMTRSRTPVKCERVAARQRSPDGRGPLGGRSGSAESRDGASRAVPLDRELPYRSGW